MLRYIFLFIGSLLYLQQASAQAELTIKVCDSLLKPVEQAHILVHTFRKTSNPNGISKFSLPKGRYSIKISHISFNDYTARFTITKDTVITILLRERKASLQEIVVTAHEKKALTSTSVIDRKAMQHLQPSSFADLVSLLPGKSVSAPILNQANVLTLRETGIASSDYATSSLGVSFTIDDIPINSNINMQKIVGTQMIMNSGYVDGKRNTTRLGVDMRAIATDEIEKVEIVRGIAPVTHGDLSSGLVQISRKKGATGWNARFKSDGFSKLFYVGKGFHNPTKQFSINLNVDYLDSKADPRNPFENYQRYTASLRTEKTFNRSHPIRWAMHFDYTGTADKEKKDADAGFDLYDSYRSVYQSYRFSNIFSMQISKAFFNRLHLKTSVNQSFDQLKQTRWVQITSAKALPIQWSAGEHYGIFMKPNYISELLIDGKPLDIYTDFSATSTQAFLGFDSELLIGASYSYSKNNGKGQIYDPTQPPSADMFTIPRAFYQIPAMQHLTFYAQEQVSRKIAHIQFTLRGGVRATSFLGLERHSLNKRFFFDPRVNLLVDFPAIRFANQKHLSIYLTTGWGRQSKLPTQEMLFPQDHYHIFTQMNYYHNNKAYRQVHFKTYIFPQENALLQPAVNTKKEIRIGFSYDYHSLYITYFNEQMESGFRKMKKFHPITYKKYHTDSIDHNAITSPPLVEDVSYSVEKALVLSAFETNGSAVYKQGVEFQYSGKRLEAINTRFSLNGAWFHTRYSNSLPALHFASKDVLNGIKYYNIGVYDEIDNYDRTRLQTSFTADTYLPKLKLTTSLRVDCLWHSRNQVIPVNGIPTHYIDVNGITHPYTQTQMQDAVLQWLMRPVSVNLVTETPLEMKFHLKISKTFYKHFTTSMYVNNLFSFYKDYYVNNQKINRRGLTSPYFGMEMNINF